MSDITGIKKYDVAGHVFAVEDTEGRGLTLASYRPFETAEGLPLFTLSVAGEYSDALAAGFEEDTRQDDGDQIIISGKLSDGRKAFVYEWTKGKALLASNADYSQATLYANDEQLRHAVDNSLMLLYALATAPSATLLFHSSTVVSHGKAYMFLGVSGTGKSTHSRLWLKNIEGTWLLNDDNPVVRLDAGGKACVYGSPWSGKTPCYINDHYPLGGVVQLRQAPHNSIRRQTVMEAYASIVGSVSGKRWEKNIADGQHATTDAMIRSVGMWHLDCLPDAAAALLCHDNITKE